MVCVSAICFSPDFETFAVLVIITGRPDFALTLTNSVSVKDFFLYLEMSHYTPY